MAANRLGTAGCVAAANIVGAGNAEWAAGGGDAAFCGRLAAKTLFSASRVTGLAGLRARVLSQRLAHAHGSEDSARESARYKP